MVYEIREVLKQKQDKKYKAFNERIGITNHVIGVRMPELKMMARNMAKENYQDYLNKNLYYHEEVMLQGLIIGNLQSDKVGLDKIYHYLDCFVPKISNWAICDTTVWKLKVIEKHLEYFKPLILKYLNSKKEYELRFSIVAMLAYYLNDEFIDWVLEQIVAIQHPGYYVKMAVAWLLATAYLEYPDKVEKILKENLLDSLTHNKCIQKIQESKLVPPASKEKLKKWKRR